VWADKSNGISQQRIICGGQEHDRLAMQLSYSEIIKSQDLLTYL